MEDLLARRNRAFRVLSDTFVEVESGAEQDVMGILCRNLRKITSASWSVLISVDSVEAGLRMSLEAVDGDAGVEMSDCRGLTAELPLDAARGLLEEDIHECGDDDFNLIEFFSPQSGGLLKPASGGKRYRVACAEQGKLIALAIVQLPEGRDMDLGDIVATYVKTAGMILLRIKAGKALERHEAELEKTKKELETRVKERTRELEDLNRNLRSEIEKRNEVEQRLKGQEEQLRQAVKMEALGRLAGGIAHDFNNLLMSILGFSKMVHEDMRPDDPSRPDIEKVIFAGERAAELTQRLLAMGRKQIVEPGVIGVNDVVKEVDNLLRRTIGENIELVTVFGEDAGCVDADFGQLEQVVMNLAVNARDSMVNGGKLTVSTERVFLSGEEAGKAMLKPGSYVLIKVRDSGCGMPEEVQEHIFEPFYTTKREGQGTGLGLSTVYGIVKQYEGGIVFDSSVGRGTEFRVYLPVSKEVLPTWRVSTEGEIPGGDERILLVEDEETVREVASRILRSLGYDVIESGNGTTALERSRKFDGEIDLLLTDMVMPIMGGVQLADEIRKQRPDIRILFMTGFSHEAAKTAESSPGRPLLRKPFDKRTLALKVRDVLDGSAQGKGKDR